MTNNNFNLEMVNMNMIVSTSDLVGYEAENTKSTESARKEALNKLVSLWENKAKNAKRAGSLGMIAVSLAACNSDDDSDALAALQTQLTAAQAAQASAEAAQATAEAAAATAAAAPAAAAAAAVGGGVLTTGIDSVLPAASNDSVTAGLTGTIMTLQSLDSIDTGGGIDSIVAIINADVTPAIANVENFSVSASAAAVLDMSASSGYTSITNTGSAGLLQVTNISSTDTELSYKNSDAGATFNYTAAAKLGTTTAQTINVDNVGGGNLTMSGVEVITINAAGQGSTINYIATAGNAATTMNLTGSQTLTLTGNQTATTVDASAHTGSTTVTLTPAAAGTFTGGTGANSFTITPSAAVIETVIGGAGNDTVDMGAQLANTDKLDGGDGTDILRSDDASLVALTQHATQGFNIKNFETVYIDDSLAADIVLDGANGIQAAGSLGTLTLTGTTGVRSITSTETQYTITNSLAYGNNLTVTDGAGVAIDNSITLSSKAAAGTDIFNGKNFTGTGVEELIIDTSNTGTVTAALGTVTVDADTGGTEKVSIIGGDKATLAGFDAITLDATGMTAQAAGITLSMGAAATKATTITGSPGSDTLVGTTTAATTIDGGAGNDTITGGTGNDTLTGGEGNDTITINTGMDIVNAGAGDDTIVVTDGDLTAALSDTIDGGAGTDTLQLSEAVSAANTGSISGMEVLSLTESLTQPMTDITGANVITTILAPDNVGGALSVTNASSTVQTLNFQDNVAQNFTFARLVGSGTADTITINGQGHLHSTPQDVAMGVVTIDDVEDVTITAGGTTDGTGDMTIATLNAAVSKTITITGTNDVIITNALNGTGALTASAVTSVDSSGLSSAGSATVISSQSLSPLTMTSGPGGASFTGGFSNDTFVGNSGVDVFVGGGGGDTISTAAGIDNLTGGAGNDTLTGGAGSDVFIFNTISNASDTDVITDLALGTTATQVDTINLAAWDTATFGGAWNFDGGGFNSVAFASAGAAATTVDVLVLDAGSYVNAAAAEVASNAASANANTDIIIIWQDTAGVVHIAGDDDRDTDAGANADNGIYDIATLTGITLTGLVTSLDIADIVI
jgi:Ca2+-binding RTX toxin-like protein